MHPLHCEPWEGGISQSAVLLMLSFLLLKFFLAVWELGLGGIIIICPAKLFETAIEINVIKTNQMYLNDLQARSQ